MIGPESIIPLNSPIAQKMLKEECQKIVINITPIIIDGKKFSEIMKERKMNL